MATYVRTRYSTRSRDTATAAEWRAASALVNLLEEPVDLQSEGEGEPEPEPEWELEPEPEHDCESLSETELDSEDEELSGNWQERRQKARMMHHEMMRSIGLATPTPASPDATSATERSPRPSDSTSTMGRSSSPAATSRQTQHLHGINQST